MTVESSSQELSPQTRVAVEDLEDAIKVIKLRRAGFSLYEISETTSVPYSRVKKLLKQAVEQLGLIKHEEAEQLRELENERLDKMLVSIWERASNGSLPHIATVLKIMERRSKLLALDLKPENAEDKDNAIVIPEWAYRKRADPDVIEYQQKELEDGDVSRTPGSDDGVSEVRIPRKDAGPGI